jgi:hypothetical protein
LSSTVISARRIGSPTTLTILRSGERRRVIAGPVESHA